MPKRLFTDADAMQLANDYLHGQSASAIARTHDISANTVITTMARIGVFVKRTLAPDSRESTAVTLYKSGMTCERIAKRFAMSSATVEFWIGRSGCRRTASQAKRVYRLDETVFHDSILNDEAAYWVGFIMADGWICHRRAVSPSLNVSIAERDATHLKKLQTFLNTDQPIYITKAGRGYSGSTPQHQLSIRSTQIVADLERYGVVKNKSHTAKVEYLQRSAAFWRGCIDGDGYLRFDSRGLPLLGLVGSYCLLEQFRSYVRSLGLGTNATVHKMNSIFAYVISGMYAQECIKHIYPINCVSLDRKYATSRLVLQWISKRPDRFNYHPM